MSSSKAVTRRNFLANVTALGVASLVGSSQVGPTPIASNSAPSLDQMTANDFRRLIGQTFRIELEDGTPVEARLQRVQTHAVSSNRRQAFSLMFQAAGIDALPHQTYPLEHAQLGRHDVFLGAVGHTSPDVCLEAVFG